MTCEDATLEDLTPENLTTALRAFIGMPAREFVPHREPLLLIDTLVDISAKHAICAWQASLSAFFKPGLGLPAYAGIETMAQCVAAHAGACARVSGLEPPIGLLLGTREFLSSVTYFEPHAAYTAQCDMIFTDENGMSAFACELQEGGRAIASAKLTVLERLPDSQQ